MTEEQEVPGTEAPDADDQGGEGAPEPFDQNPPVNPSQPQVGNSRAQFFMPCEESEGDEDEGAGEDASEEEVREGDA